MVEGLPQFAETRGGDSYFVPRYAALRSIELGVIDPTEGLKIRRSRKII
ncbi:MAG: hypothetical protein FWD08_01580 [Alphaproteobacteria bacterium]|nr:hypothetical protein [Alphaproteobacteria bacterium]